MHRPYPATHCSVCRIKLTEVVKSHVATKVKTLRNLERQQAQLPRYPGQFVLAPYCVTHVADWQHIAISSSLCLSSHPSLPVTQIGDDKIALTCIGYLLDPWAPERGDADILAHLRDQARDLDTLIAATSQLGGRWIIIAHWSEGSERIAMFHDALGLRQIFHTRTEDGSIWAATQPGLLADILDLQLDPAAELFMTSTQFRRHREYQWPGSATAFREIRHLLPNHALDLQSQQVTRYWPRRAPTPMSRAVAQTKLRDLFEGLILAAANRFPLVVGLTAGLDSRLVLAASRSIVTGISFITVRQSHFDDDHRDVAIAKRLATRFGLSHAVVEAAHTTSPDFAYAFKSNVFCAHEHYAADAEALYDHFQRQSVALTGSAGEVGRVCPGFTAPVKDPADLNAEHLAQMQNMPQIPFVANAFADWLDDARDIGDFDILDLLDWEQEHGNWLAMTQLEFDIAWRDIFTPFNCREVLSTLLSVPESERSAPDYRLITDIIKIMWPELLSEPINPGDRTGDNWLQKIKGLLKSTIAFIR